MNKTRSTEFAPKTLLPGLPMLVLAILLTLSPALWIWFAVEAGTTGRAGMALLWGLMNLPALLAAVLTYMGLVVVQPNQSEVLVLFGRYIGTIRKDGYFWVNPFTAFWRRKVSLRIRNFDSQKLKVNDKNGNPIDIAAIVVWRVRDTAQAAFDVEDFEDYVKVQSEAAVRHLAASHPYDSQDGELSLRGSADVVNSELLTELGERLSLAGIDVLEARLSHLAYAQEIAGAMLRRQQADAIIAARARIVDGAVGMVQMALAQLQQSNVVQLDEDRKAAMVSNLLVVLCGEENAQPVLNTGSLY